MNFFILPNITTSIMVAIVVTLIVFYVNIFWLLSLFNVTIIMPTSEAGMLGLKNFNL